MRPAQPAVNLSARVSLETDERRRRLQARTGYATPRLLDEALRALETDLDHNLDSRKGEIRELKARAPPS